LAIQLIPSWGKKAFETHGMKEALMFVAEETGNPGNISSAVDALLFCPDGDVTTLMGKISNNGILSEETRGRAFGRFMSPVILHDESSGGSSYGGDPGGPML